MNQTDNESQVKSICVAHHKHSFLPWAKRSTQRGHSTAVYGKEEKKMMEEIITQSRTCTNVIVAHHEQVSGHIMQIGIRSQNYFKLTMMCREHGKVCT